MPSDRRSHWTPGRKLRQNEMTRIAMIGAVARNKPAISRTVSSTSRSSCAFLALRQCRTIGMRSMPRDGATARCDASSSLVTEFAYSGLRYAAAHR
jgi:hypothetical protein